MQRPDGRHERSTRTRASILAAHRALVARGVLAPTTSRIAEEAGVSPRTFFAHFPDLETLLAATADSVYDEVLARRRRPDPALPLSERLDAFLDNRDELYRFLTPFSLAVRIREQTSPALRERRGSMARLSLQDVAAAFAPELQGLPVDEQEDVVAALETCTTWSTWYHLREELVVGEAAARRIMTRLALQVLQVPA